jgi:hypothetical protein
MWCCERDIAVLCGAVERDIPVLCDAVERDVPTPRLNSIAAKNNRDTPTNITNTSHGACVKYLKR